MAGLLTHGSRPDNAFPSSSGQWPDVVRIPAYSAGPWRYGFAPYSLFSAGPLPTAPSWICGRLSTRTGKRCQLPAPTNTTRAANIISHGP